MDRELSAGRTRCKQQTEWDEREWLAPENIYLPRIQQESAFERPFVSG
jgi:hypothetical protein